MARRTVAEQLATIRTGGTVEVRTSRLRLAAFGLVATGFVVLGGGFLYGALVSPEISPAHVVVGALSIGFFGVFGVPALALQALRPLTISLDRHGIVLDRTSALAARPTPREFRWSDFGGFERVSTGHRSPRFVVGVLAVRDSNTHGRASSWMSGATFTFPNTVEGGQQHLLELLRSAHAEFAPQQVTTAPVAGSLGR